MRSRQSRGHLGCEVLRRAEPPSWSQNLIPVGDMKGSLWKGKLRHTKGKGWEEPLGKHACLSTSSIPATAQAAGPSSPFTKAHLPKSPTTCCMEPRTQNKTSSVNHRHVGCAGSLKIKLQCTRTGWGLERMFRTVGKTGPQPSAPQLTA